MRAQVPKPDFMDLGGYQRALEMSTNPQSKAILRKITNGPADLVCERAAAQREGLVVDIAQLQRPLPPPGENAALLYAAWRAQWKKEAFALPLYAYPLSSRYAYTPQQLAQVQTLFDQHRDIIALLHHAADTPQCVFPENWQKKPYFPDFPTPGSLREAAREINTESFLLAKQGRYSEAIVNQTRGFHIADHAASDPTLIHYLIGAAIEQITLRGMEGILDLAGPNAAVAQQVQQAIAAHHSHFSLRHALSGETAVTLSYTELLRATTPADLADFASDHTASARDSDKRYSPEEKQFLAELVDAVEACYIYQMRRVVAVADGSPASRASVFATVPDRTASPLNPVDLLADKELVVFQLLDQHENSRRGEEQCAMAGAAALAVCGRSGVFPARLPGNFSDPYHDNQPLQYRREGTNGFVVYSVGPKGDFDGGKPGEHHWEPFEIAFRYPVPPPQPVPPEMLK